ncbi:hypothetical protein PpBr36_08117 [Pyricularia pennisetigena]|uniref:hypothetical protein n=1 Tax=Pyricularia pennisetigena TaxID=1578925 RepID=UPI001152333F|nr:hypothetical protein PpBr36_08117 [Pyricularia pennisetigena]TLS23952.1 hypothetical protein PpBr36_08117 [Pyricularia pennisetigena]
MDSRDSKPQDAEWMESRQGQTGTPTPAEDEDDIMLQALGVCDGFRPNAVTSTTSFPDRNPVSTYSSQGEAIPSTPVDRNLTVSPLSRQSSISKPPIAYNPSAGAHALGSESLHPLHNARPSYPLSRQVSSATSISTTSSAFTDAAPVLVREQSYQGPSGPSHPYTLYRQDIGLNRSLSVNTTSTARPSAEQPFLRSIGPVHPYGLYDQNTVGIDQIVAGSGLAGGIVGFPGIATDSYRRRLGPDGEEIGGLIGPHGHTEELPPYTRYPDEQYARKVRDAEALSSLSSPPPSAQPHVYPQRRHDNLAQAPLPIPGAGGMGIAARNPEFDSIDDLTSPALRHSSGSYTSAATLSQHGINTEAAAIVSENEKPAKRWRATGKRRLCGIIPYWAVLLALTGLLVLGIILGAVVGTYAARRERDKEAPGGGPSPETPPLYDATPIPIPKDLPELPEGRFGMPLVIRQQPNICFNDTTHALAWSCSIIFGFGAAMTMDVKKESDKYSVSIGANDSLTINNGLYAYGTQPQVIQGTHVLQTVVDLLEPSRGPAWFKMLPFNKTVIVPENLLSATSPNTAARFRRALNPPVFGPNDFRHKFAAQPGDKPWICTWPDTLLEIFIYPNQSSTPAIVGGQPSSMGAVAPTTTPPSLTRGAPFPFLTGTSVPTGVFSDFFGATDRFSLPTPGPTPTIAAGDGEFAPLLPGYPRVVKLEERRVQNSPRPVCRQVLIENGGTAKPVMNNGKPVEITILEQGNSPPLTKRSEGDGHLGAESQHIVRRDPADVSDCGCVWFMN